MSLLWLSPQGALTTVDGYQLTQDSFASFVAPERQSSEESDDVAVGENHVIPSVTFQRINAVIYLVDIKPHKQRYYVRGPPLLVA
ncbi:hypothetical protein D3795_03140 [Pseudidiomarina andamanensis]|uniref:Uncharacterized protein n=1 Tax=Pseudidiomarina andamanensis TaxID=1940690 RepID=A0AA92IL80_9GAMM|nr:hypothetical protein D3795_03140 [Pseudidiomarina andamanensis]